VTTPSALHHARQQKPGGCFVAEVDGRVPVWDGKGKAGCREINATRSEHAPRVPPLIGLICSYEYP
jgi:hypothetical protein